MSTTERPAAATSTRPVAPPRVTAVTLRDMLVVAFLACNTAQSCEAHRTTRAAIARCGR